MANSLYPQLHRLLLSLHIWEPLAGWTWGYCTPPHIKREAWLRKARAIIHRRAGVCVCVWDGESWSVQESENSPLTYTFSFHYDFYVLHRTCIAHKRTIIVLTSDHLLLLFFSLCLSPGRALSWWARGWLRLLPSAVLAGRTPCGCGGDRYPAHLRVLCVPVLPPRLCFTVSGLLLCSQVGFSNTDEPHRPFSLVSKAFWFLFSV